MYGVKRSVIFLSLIEVGTYVKSDVISQFKKVCEIIKFVKIMAQTCLNGKSTCDLTDVPASMYGRKTTALPFDTIYDILRSHSLAQSVLKGRFAPFRRSGNRGVNIRVIFISGN